MLKLYVMIGDDYKEVDSILRDDKLKPTTKTLIEEAISNYINLCTSEKCKKNQNVEKYLFNRFSEYLAKKNLIYISDVSEIHLLEYQKHLGENTKASSVNRRFCTIKNFFSMCYKWEYIVKNPAKNIGKKRVEKNPYKNWTQADFIKLINTTDGVYKDCLDFLMHTGCRPSELANFKWTDIDYDRKCIFFSCGKNAHIKRDFPLSNEVSEILHRIKPTGINVFLYKNKIIKTDSLSHYVRKKLIKLGLNHLSVYGLRHSFAERMVLNNVSPFYIQKLMGHADIKTTMGYCHDDRKALQQIINNIKY